MFYAGGRKKSTPVGNAYYFDSINGNDSNNGKNPNTAWKTIAKFNATSFAAGTTICFVRGGQWTTGTLYLHNAGSSVNPIRITAYGSGALPIIHHIRSDVPHGRADYTTIDNIEIVGGEGAGLEIWGSATNLTLRDLVVHDCRGQGLFFESAFDGDMDDILISDVEVYNCMYQGIYLHTTTVDSHIIGVVVRRVHSYNNGLLGGAGQQDNLDGIVCSNLDNGIVEKCWSHDNDGDGIDIGGSIGTVMRYNLANNNTGTGLVFSNTCDGCIMHGNLSHHNDVGLFFKRPTQNCAAYNNTLAYSTTYGAMLDCETAATAVTFKNNIIVNEDYASSQPSLWTRESIQTLACDYNVYLHPVNQATQFYDYAVTTHYSFSEWQALGYDANSYNANPNLDSSYVPVVGSNAIDNGVDLGSAYQNALDPRTVWTNSVRLMLQDASWDIGAYIR